MCNTSCTTLPPSLVFIMESHSTTRQSTAASPSIDHHRRRGGFIHPQVRPPTKTKQIAQRNSLSLSLPPIKPLPARSQKESPPKNRGPQPHTPIFPPRASASPLTQQTATPPADVSPPARRAGRIHPSTCSGTANPSPPPHPFPSRPRLRPPGRLRLAGGYKSPALSFPSSTPFPPRFKSDSAPDSANPARPNPPVPQ